jgi:hypothetical protein
MLTSRFVCSSTPLRRTGLSKNTPLLLNTWCTPADSRDVQKVTTTSLPPLRLRDTIATPWSLRQSLWWCKNHGLQQACDMGNRTTRQYKGLRIQYIVHALPSLSRSSFRVTVPHPTALGPVHCASRQHKTKCFTQHLRGVQMAWSSSQRRMRIAVPVGDRLAGCECLDEHFRSSHQYHVASFVSLMTMSYATRWPPYPTLRAPNNL